MRNKVSILLATFILALSLNAGGESVIGVQFPLGMPITPNSSISLSMGGTGVGTMNDNNVLLFNPANLGFINKTVFSSLASLDFLNLLNTESNTATNHLDFLPRQLAFGIPLGVAGTIGFSYAKRFDDRVRFLERQWVGIPSIDSIELSLGRNGGVTGWQAGWGYAIGKWAAVGVSYERAYYYLHEARTSKTYGYTSPPPMSVDTTDITMGANGFRAGIMVPAGKLTAGISGEYFFAGTAHATAAAYNGLILADSQITSSDFSLTLPPSIAVGLSYKFAPEWLAALDVSATLWNSFHDDGRLLSGELHNAFSYSAGGQYIPAPNLLTPKYWEIIQYRAGARYTQLPVKSAAEYAFSFGTGLPFSKGAGLFDVVLEYGRRFDTSFKNNQEEFFSIGFGFNGGRKWAASTQNGY
jgi:hypothetical protein